MESTAYPKLPGFTPGHDPTKTGNKRVSHVQQAKNSDYINKGARNYALPRRPVPEQVNQEKAFSMMSTTQATYGGKEVTEQFEPLFVKLDKQVLRFTAFFKESIPESRLENMRIRRLTVQYYLEDHTIQILEEKQMNSGMPQGIFLKRQLVMKQDQSGMPILPEDLKVRSSIMIYGRNIIITDCDQYTRECYDLWQIPQPEATEIPEDNFAQKQNKVEVKIKDQMMKDFLEHSLGGGRPANQKQFLDNDRRVLRFYCESGEPYTLHYYLADDTIEILESHLQNSGRYPFPLMLRRKKLPKSFVIGQPGQSPEEQFIDESEIFADQLLYVNGRPFKILAADQFTVEYYKEHYNRDFPLGPPEPKHAAELAKHTIPPHNGIGSEEDSLQNVFRLEPKAPHKDYFKFIDNSSKILRWTSYLNTTIPEDKDRRFIISYLLHDDTLQIHEVKQKNSGIQEGKFLKRNKYKNKCTGTYFHPSDFQVHQDIIINDYSFHIDGQDEMTRKFMEQAYGIGI